MFEAKGQKEDAAFQYFGFFLISFHKKIPDSILKFNTSNSKLLSSQRNLKKITVLINDTKVDFSVKTSQGIFFTLRIKQRDKEVQYLFE